MENIETTYLKKPCNTLSAFVKRCFDIMRDGTGGWDLHIGPSSREEFTQVLILDNSCGTVAFRDPFDNVSTAIYMIYISLYAFRQLSTY